MKNYVSVTAGKSIEEANMVINGFQKAGYELGQEYNPVIGIQVSTNTLNNVKPKNLRFALFQDVPSILQAVNDRVTPVIHYNTKTLDNLSEDVIKIFNETYEYCKLVQINATFPDISHLQRIKEKFNDLEISLQIDYSNLDIKEIPDKVNSYGDSVDYLLIDPSRGRGDMFDLETSAEIYLGIKDKNPDYKIVIAGGLSGDNVEEVLGSLIDKIKTKDFSTCAEGQLRDKVSDEFWGMDELNVLKMEEYLKASREILS